MYAGSLARTPRVSDASAATSATMVGSWYGLDPDGNNVEAVCHKPA
jgi:hypothetical protein